MPDEKDEEVIDCPPELLEQIMRGNPPPGFFAAINASMGRDNENIVKHKEESKKKKAR